MLIFRSLSHLQLSKIYNLCDVYIQPSLYESFSLTVLEALACGKVVVASKVGGIPEFLRNEKNGFLVSPKPKEFISKILEILEGNKNLERIKRNALLTAKEFSWEVVAKKTLRLFKSIL
ncbi:MAG: hypothetical protein DRP00_06400 [Candidatus Aenigmatarchaeota archaeon]|nr:MAG: hypothetical protein DRP00_06400 [Candidatus Aenigmarchaeota archaeon]